jgi:GT2 family glycosyltransferase
MFDLSIVLPTCNRAPLLAKAIESIASTTTCNYELIVVDGASTDDTAGVLLAAKDDLGDRLRVIVEDKREGFVRGTNKGFRAATGRNLTWINDDARPIGESLDIAVQQIDSSGPDVGFVAMFHRWHSRWNIAYETQVANRKFQLCHIRGTLYANFPVGRRETYQKLGLFDERYYVCAADPDLSLKAWHAGMQVVPAFGAIIDHDEVEDDRRSADSSRGQEDNARLFAKWSLPPKNTLRNDFDPARPCTLIGINSGAMAA